jgi:NADH-quinone oxidoreductase subunit M
MGFVMLGISTLTSLGINAALFGMVAHGLITGMLFFIAGSVKERYHTLEIKRLSGMLQQMPKLGWILGFCAMASLGLPGLAGFWGEFPAILASWNPLHGGTAFGGLSLTLFRTLTVIAALGTVLAAAYLLWLYQRTAMGEVSPEFATASHGDAHGHDAHGHDALAHDALAHDDHSSDIHDVNKFEWMAWTPLLVAIVVFGVLPQLMFKVLDPGVTELVKVFGGK